MGVIEALKKRRAQQREDSVDDSHRSHLEAKRDEIIREVQESMLGTCSNSVIM